MTTDKINHLLDDVRAVWGAATPGPWHLSDYCLRAVWPDEGPPVVFSDAGVRRETDARAIAAAPQHITQLCAVVEQLMREVVVWRGGCTDLGKNRDTIRDMLRDALAVQEAENAALKRLLHNIRHRLIRGSEQNDVDANTCKYLVGWIEEADLR